MLSQQYEKVKESEKMKSEFINIAAHELRTPIQPILGLTDVIYSKVKDKEQHELLDIIMRNAYRLKRLSDNLLDVTKIESQSLMLKKEKLNLNVLISEVLKEYVNKEVKQQMVKIGYDFKYLDDIIVEADRDRLAQVIRNLVDNALKFTTMYNNQQTIFVIVDKKKEEGEGKEQAIVSVKDTGAGISKEVLPKLFSKFTTGDSGTGTGLGLYICKNIVEAHGGKIWAENNLMVREQHLDLLMRRVQLRALEVDHEPPEQGREELRCRAYLQAQLVSPGVGAVPSPQPQGPSWR